MDVRRYPGFLAAEAVARGANPTEETYCRFNRFVEWIEDHKFASLEKKAGLMCFFTTHASTLAWPA